MNNAANDEDIKNGTTYAGRNGIKVSMPKWGISKGDYFFDHSKNIITKGITSVKYMSNAVAEELYSLANKKQYNYFVDVLLDMSKETSVDARQLDILIKIDFFSEFGNQRELLRLADMFTTLFKKGDVKKLAKDKVAGTPLEPIIQKYATGTTKAGKEAKSYTVLDVPSVMRETEDYIKTLHMADLSDILKVRNFADVMGYVGYVSGKEEDRKKLYVMDLYPLKRKRDGKQFGFSVVTKSIGSGKEARFTVMNHVFMKEPIQKNDIIYCKSFERDGPYYRLTSYNRVFGS